uniref:Dynactin subunit 6 n=1 Tax=Trichogramma kaykai TaxID=54128 RepID=A0ABD2VSY7_9HYME
MASSNRRSNLKVAEGAIVCDEAVLKGDITIGRLTVIHPRANIIAEAGPIIIGDGNIIEEMCTIINRGSGDLTTTPVQIIGNYNIFEVDSTCEASKVGDNNILECKSFVGKEVELSNGCVVGVGCSMTEHEVVPENTIVYSDQHLRREMRDKPNARFDNFTVRGGDCARNIPKKSHPSSASLLCIRAYTPIAAVAAPENVVVFNFQMEMLEEDFKKRNEYDRAKRQSSKVVQRRGLINQVKHLAVNRCVPFQHLCARDVKCVAIKVLAIRRQKSIVLIMKEIDTMMEQEITDVVAVNDETMDLKIRSNPKPFTIESLIGSGRTSHDTVKKNIQDSLSQRDFFYQQHCLASGVIPGS